MIQAHPALQMKSVGKFPVAARIRRRHDHFFHAFVVKHTANRKGCQTLTPISRRILTGFKVPAQLPGKTTHIPRQDHIFHKPLLVPIRRIKPPQNRRGIEINSGFQIEPLQRKRRFQDHVRR